MALARAAIDPAFRSLSRQPAPDPDIAQVLSDFLSFTEHFPSHLTRALALIQDQRTRAEEKIRAIHDDTTTYSRLPSIRDAPPDPAKLRRDISYALEEAERASRMSVEEAVRMEEEAHRESRRLDEVVRKLKAQPLPPSRDPTPEQQALTSPNLKRERRLSMRAEDGRTEKQSRRLHDRAATKLRGRKVMVPGEVLPPPDPNAPPESLSDWTSPAASPPILDEPLLPPGKKSTTTPRPRSHTPRPSRLDRERDRKTPKPRGPRAPGQPGTNAHSAVAGISTSNALLALTQPPEVAPKGSRWLPWMKLTEWEMAKLRKRMKKNAIWVPSQTMVRRELKNLGRGVAGREAAKAYAEEIGEAFVDEHSELDPTKVMISGEETAQINAMLGPSAYPDDEDADAELINRGMRLNEAKKLKRQRLLEEQQLQAQLAREQGVEAPIDTSSKRVSTSPEAQKKRKREATPATTSANASLLDTPEPLSKGAPATKKLKITASNANGLTTSKVPLAPAGASSSPKSTAARTRLAATPPAAKRPTITLKIGKAVSEEPPNRRASLRRSSNASMPTTSTSTLTSPKQANPPPNPTIKNGRRGKRPAPGIVTNTDDSESAKVGVSQRKAAPRKRATAATAGKKDSIDPAVPPTDGFAEEEVDPDEPRYCICGDVSWGTMIACDNEESCEKEWFHLECVKLEGMPPRRTKWYCPDCRKKLKLGQATNGLVGPSGRSVATVGR